jgi:hypothetical protein
MKNIANADRPKSAAAMLPPRPLRGSGKVAQTAFKSERRDGKSCIPTLIRLLLIHESGKFQTFVLLELLTVSEKGRQARGVMLGLAKTCAKLKIRFFDTSEPASASQDPKSPISQTSSGKRLASRARPGICPVTASRRLANAKAMNQSCVASAHMKPPNSEGRLSRNPLAAMRHP